MKKFNKIILFTTLIILLFLSACGVKSVEVNTIFTSDEIINKKLSDYNISKEEYGLFVKKINSFSAKASANILNEDVLNFNKEYQYFYKFRGEGKGNFYTDFDNIYLVAAASELAGAEIELANEKDREYKLKNSLDKIKDDYDYIFIDCPPSLGMLTINSLTASDSVLIPIQCEYYALEGVSQLMSTFKLVKKRLNPNIEIQGVVLSMFDGRANLSIQVVEEVKKYFKGSVYTTLIPRNVRLAEAPSYGKPVIYYDTKCRGTEAYKELAEEFIELEEDVI